MASRKEMARKCPTIEAYPDHTIISTEYNEWRVQTKSRVMRIILGKYGYRVVDEQGMEQAYFPIISDRNGWHDEKDIEHKLAIAKETAKDVLGIPNLLAILTST